MRAPFCPPPCVAQALKQEAMMRGASSGGPGAGVGAGAGAGAGAGPVSPGRRDPLAGYKPRQVAGSFQLFMLVLKRSFVQVSPGAVTRGCAVLGIRCRVCPALLHCLLRIP
jgi:hypothetical protein